MQKVIAKLFKNGGSRAVRIPAAWGFDQDEVTLNFDEVTRRIIMEEIPKSNIADFFALQDELGVQNLDGWPQRDQPIDDFASPFELSK